jgi:hypothetical protein
MQPTQKASRLHEQQEYSSMRKEIMMQKLKSTKTLAMVVFVSGMFDLAGGFYYAFLVGIGRSIESPPTHPFYAILIGSFLCCLAYLQLLSAFNIRRYLFIIGAVMISRIFYAVLLFAYLVFVPDFPTTFLPTAILDLTWAMIYIVLSVISDEIRFKDLFIPKWGDN